MSTTLATPDPYILQLVSAANKLAKTDGAFRVSEDCPVLIDPTEHATDEQILEVIAGFGRHTVKLDHQAALVRWNALRMVQHLAARRGMTYSDTIIDLGIPDRMGVKTKTILNWMPVVSKVPYSLLMETPNCTWNHYVVASEVMAPEDPERTNKFLPQVREVLIAASESPSDRPSTWVRGKLNEVREALRKPGLYDELGLRDRAYDIALLLLQERELERGTVTPEALGFKDRAHFNDVIDESIGWGINRKIIPADPSKKKCFILRKAARIARQHTNGTTVEAEIVKEEEENE